MGEKTASPPSDEVLQAAMNLAAGVAVPAEYGLMVREQMGLGPAVARREWTQNLCTSVVMPTCLA